MTWQLPLPVVATVVGSQDSQADAAVRMFESLARSGGAMAAADRIAYFMGEIGIEHAERLARLGVALKVVDAAADSGMEALPIAALLDTDETGFLVVLAPEAVIVGDFAEWIDGPPLSVKRDPRAIPGELALRLQASNKGAALALYDAGVLLVRRDLAPKFGALWDAALREVRELAHDGVDTAPHGISMGALALSLASARSAMEVHELPSEFPVENGSDPGGPPAAGAAMSGAVIDVTATAKHVSPNFNNQLFWDHRYQTDPDRGSGLGSRGAPRALKESVIRQAMGECRAKSVLDVGCGDLASVEKLRVSKYTGIDIAQVVQEANARKRPDWTFLCGDFVQLYDREPFQSDLVLCFDVLIHQHDFSVYEEFVRRLVQSCRGIGLVGAFQAPPRAPYRSDITAYHEPITRTLARMGARDVKIVASYRDTVVAQFRTTLKTFDCFQYDGEIDLLAIRLQELNDVVDHFVVVESAAGPGGSTKAIKFNPLDPQVVEFAGKIRHVVVRETPAVAGTAHRDSPWLRAVLRGIPDALADDLVMVSDVCEIPRATAVRAMAQDLASATFCVELAPHCFYVNYRNIGWAGPSIARMRAARRRTWGQRTGDETLGEQDPPKVVGNGGWQFLHMMDQWRVRRQGASPGRTSKPLPSAPAIEALVRQNADPFDRPGLLWAVSGLDDLPAWLRENRGRFGHLFLPADGKSKEKGRQKAMARGTRAASRPPVVICPYLFDHEPAEVRAKFGLDRPECRHIQFFFWKDTDRIGPERAFQHCWNQFPDDDIVIIHSDMSPIPGEPPNRWYDELCRFRDRLPWAGMIACNLLYPRESAKEPLEVQCAGGTYVDAKISHLHGPAVRSSREAGVPQALLEQVRIVDWVTFGGLLMRRDLIRACGPFDERYEWAYVMDVDYSFEARLRGFVLVHVPVSLQHEESRTTRAVTRESPQMWQSIGKNMERFYRKWKPFRDALPASAVMAGNSYCGDTIRELNSHGAAGRSKGRAKVDAG